MRQILINQEIVLHRFEIMALLSELLKFLHKPVDQENKLQPLEVLAFPYLESLAKRLARRMVGSPQKGIYKVKLSAHEIIAVQALIRLYPPELYNTFSLINCKALNYDQVINFHI
ncbi:hypothetical protein [Pontibacter pamirensis]|uniref:hypothetical protein n=1 Tax=Pontibacter pamirensis TaxID=2562824 RepID=UPI0013896DE3|nr:hypothetical protein [Pontibacter pamirensis]